jgi:hypothetical protein
LAGLGGTVDAVVVVELGGGGGATVVVGRGTVVVGRGTVVVGRGTVVVDEGGTVEVVLGAKGSSVLFELPGRSKSQDSRPSVASSMNLRQIWAGKEPPTTSIPCTEFM